MMELRHLEVFLAVVEHQGFRRAAARLYLSQPAISARVHELEHSLGTSLFERGRPGVELTPAGQALVVVAQRVLDEAHAARRAATLTSFTGTLAVGIIPGGALELTRPLLIELSQRFPGVVFSFRPVTLESWHPGILGEVDLLVTREPYPVADVVSTELLREPVGVGVPAAFEESHAAVLSLEDVMASTMVRMSDTVHPAIVAHWSLEPIANGWQIERRGPSADGPLETRDRVEAGCGMAVGPWSVARLYGQSSYRFVPLEGVPDSRVVLVSSASDGGELLAAIHREAADIVKRLGPLVLGGGSSAIDEAVAAALRP